MSKIEELIEEIEQYIDSCKYMIMSNTNIIVNKDEIDSLLRELRLHTPDEIRRFQKIVSNRDAIMEDAQKQAQQLLDDAAAKTKNILSEHEILQQAQMRADDLVADAIAQAQEIVDNATNEANAYKMAAIQYTYEKLGSLESIMQDAQNIATQHYGGLLESIKANLDEVSANRDELRNDSARNVSEIASGNPSNTGEISVM